MEQRKRSIRTYGKARQQQAMSAIDFFALSSTPPRNSAAKKRKTAAAGTPTSHPSPVPSPSKSAAYTTTPLSDAGIAPPLPAPSPNTRLVDALRAAETPTRLGRVRYRLPLAKWFLSLDDADVDIGASGSKANHNDDGDAGVDDGQEADEEIHVTQEANFTLDHGEPANVESHANREDAEIDINQEMDAEIEEASIHTPSKRKARRDGNAKPLPNDRRRNRVQSSSTKETVSKPSIIPRPTPAARPPEPNQLEHDAKPPSSSTLTPGQYVRVLLSDTTSTTAMCRISRILNDPPSNMTVQWMYFRRDLHTTPDPRLRSLLTKLRAHEALLTNHTDDIPIDSVVKDGQDIHVRVRLKGKKRKRKGDDETGAAAGTQYTIMGFWRFDEGLLRGKSVERLEDLDG
jgi:hypothetical protein